MRFAFIAVAVLSLCVGMASAQTPEQRRRPSPQQEPPHVTLPQQQQPPLALPQGPAGEGLYVAGADRVAIGRNETLVAGLQAERGAYQITARLVIANDRDNHAAVACRLTQGAGEELDYVSIAPPPRSRASLTLLAAARLDGPPLTRRVDIRCQATDGAAATVRWARIEALAVSRINGQFPPAGR